MEILQFCKVLDLVSLLYILFACVLRVKSKIVTGAVVLVFTGILGNQVAVTSNGGRMPVFIEDVSVSTQFDLVQSKRHVLGTEDTTYKFLSDIIEVKGKNITQVLSVGDICMLFGPVLLVLVCLLYTYIYWKVLFIHWFTKEFVLYGCASMTVYLSLLSKV